MVGVTSYGAYVPRWRLSRGAIAEGARGEKSICNFDEDSVTKEKPPHIKQSNKRKKIA